MSARAEFEARLEEALTGTDLAADEVLALAAERAATGYAQLSEALGSPALDLRAAVERAAGRSVRTVALLSVPSWIEPAVERFEAAFERVVLVDNKKAGTVLGSTRVQAQAELEGGRVDVDAALLASSSLDVRRLLLRSAPAEDRVEFEVLASALLASTGAQRIPADVPALLGEIARSPRPLVVLAGIYLGTYTATLHALADRGFQVFVIARTATAWAHAGHLAGLEASLAFARVVALDHDEWLEAAAGLDRGVVLIPGAEETFIGCAFDTRRAAAAYAFVAAVVHTVRVPVLLGLYDVFKPTTQGLEAQRDSVATYRRMLAGASEVVVGANADEACEYVRSALDLETRIRCFPRYGVATEPLRARHGEGIHLALVGGGLSSASRNPFFPSTEAYEGLLEQGLHLHLWSSAPAPRRFAEGLAPGLRRLFHLHDAIADQGRLARELSACHAGLILNDTEQLRDMVANYDEPFLRELGLLFLRTMVPSASMLFGCAGLPIVLNRSNTALADRFPEGTLIGTEISELDRLGERLRAIDWDELHERVRARRADFSIGHRVSELEDLLERLTPAASRDVAAG